MAKANAFSPNVGVDLKPALSGGATVQLANNTGMINALDRPSASSGGSKSSPSSKLATTRPSAGNISGGSKVDKSA